MPVAIVTDSTSDVEPELARSLGITVVPLFVVWADVSYRDYIDLSRPQFYAKLANETALPMTSQPTAKMFEDAFAPSVEAGDDIVCLVISAKLSGTINAARGAAERFPNASITIVDSESVAGGLGMMVLRACEIAQRGGTSSEIVAAIERDKRSQRLYALLPDLSHLVRNGRIGKARAAVGTLMKIVPVLSLKDGQIVAEAQVRTYSRAQETMLDLTMKNVSDIANARFRVMHTNAPALASAVVEKLRGRFSGVEPKLLNILEAGPVIATHGGPGAVGIFSAQD
ncbi:MAG: DegV family protein [Candidatus Eremiobacteraeota bacterium]|nr:DegV family protein [Candidatus Eremiobacteraeota bacterium]